MADDAQTTRHETGCYASTVRRSIVVTT